jgi:hypothetical protein
LRCLGFDVPQRAARSQALIRRVGVTSESKKERPRAQSSSRARVYIASRTRTHCRKLLPALNMSEHNIACQYFEHVAEYSVAACRECRYAVWPDQIEGHLQEQHKVSRKQADIVGEQIRSWAGLL